MHELPKHSSDDKVKVGRLTVCVEQDTDCEGPREWDNLGTMVCFHTRYNLGDEHQYADPDAFLMSLAGEYFKDLDNHLENTVWNRLVKALPDDGKTQVATYNAMRKDIIWRTIHKHYIILPLGLFDHSGISMYVGSGAHTFDPGGWDSGQVGWIYVSKQKLRSEGYGKYLTKKVLAKAEEVLRGEVSTYDQYLTGDVWGYVVKDEDGEVVDSCWGFYGVDEAFAEGEAAAKHELEVDRQCEEMERNCFAL